MKRAQQTFNCASAECTADDGLLAAESPQLVWPTGPLDVNILAAASVYQVVIEREKN